MKKAELVVAILALAPDERKGRLGKLKKAALEAKLAELSAPRATVETIPMGCPDCGSFHPGDVLERTGGACPRPRVKKDHEWKQMYDGPDSNECWSAPDSARWCGACGLRVKDVAATEGAPPCEGKPADRVLTVKGIKSFRGMEGLGFNATLYRDGKKLGLVIDEGCGGSMLFRCFKTYAEQSEYERWARVQDGASAFDPLDLIVATLVGEYEETAKLKRWCKKKTVAKLKDDPKDSYSIWKVPYTPEFAARLRKENDVVEIINERFLKGVALVKLPDAAGIQSRSARP